MRPLVSLLALLLLAMLQACATYAGIAVAPNGTIWVAQNRDGFLYQISACTVVGPELVCRRTSVREVNP